MTNTQIIPLLPSAESVEGMSIDLTKYSEAAKDMVEQAGRAEIVDAESYATGGDLIKIAAAQVKKLDAERTQLSGPFHSMWKFINAQYGTTKTEFGDVRKTIEPKMLAWKKAEDEKLRVIAAAEAKRLEDEALARAALEKTEEAQDEVMEVAAAASDQYVAKAGVEKQYGNFGSTTSTAKKYTTEIDNFVDFLRALVKHVDDGNKRGIDLQALIALNKGGLNKLAKDMRAAGVKKMPGAKFLEEDSLRVR